MEWQDVFSPIRLIEGYDDYLNERVNKYSVNNNTISGIVKNNEIENFVKIYLDENNNIKELKCSCKKNLNINCRHMAALLFKYEQFIHPSPKASNKHLMDFNMIKKPYNNKEILKKLTYENIINYLKQELNNDRIYLNLKLNSKIKMFNTDLLRYKKEILKCKNVYVNNDNYISNDYINKFFKLLNNFFYNDVSILIRNEEYFFAYKLLTLLFEIIISIEYEDNSRRDKFIIKIINEWSELIGELSYQERKLVFAYLVSNRNEVEVKFCKKLIDDIIYNNFNEEIFLDDKIVMLKEEILIAKKSLNWKLESKNHELISKYLNLVNKVNYSTETTKIECNEYWFNFDAKMIYFNLCYKNKELEEALNVSKEILKESNIEKDILINIINLRLGIFKEVNDISSYENEFIELIANYDDENLFYYKMFKKNYKLEDWKKIRERIYEKMPKNLTLLRMYENDKLKSRYFKL